MRPARHPPSRRQAWPEIRGRSLQKRETDRGWTLRVRPLSENRQANEQKWTHALDFPGKAVNARFFLLKGRLTDGSQFIDKYVEVDDKGILPNFYFDFWHPNASCRAVPGGSSYAPAVNDLGPELDVPA